MKRRSLFITALMAMCLVFISAPVLADTINLTGTVRDFKRGDLSGGHPDFETFLGDDRGIVLNTLGSDGKPVYAGQAGNPSTHGQTAFDQWYRDTAGVNQTTSHGITLNETGSGTGIYRFTSGAFFPIDGSLWGNEGLSHNYHFTYDIHSQFTYQPGQTFSFTGDDDVWVFINKQLVIDLGGVHGAETASVNLNTLGLTAGNVYSFDFFFAERHTTESNLMIETSIVLQSVPEPMSMLLLGLGLVGLAGVSRRKF